MTDPKDLLRQFQDVTNGFIKQNEDTGVIKFLRSTVKTLEIITKKIDTFLKGKNIDVGERLDQLSQKGSDIKGKAKDFLTSAKSDVKSMGVKGFLQSKAAGVKSKLGSMFISDTEVGGAPPEGENPADSKESSWIDRLQTSIGTLATSVEDLAGKSLPGGNSPVEADGSEAKDKTGAKGEKPTTPEDKTKSEKKPDKGSSWVTELKKSIATLATSVESLASKSASPGDTTADAATGSANGKALDHKEYEASLAKAKERADVRSKEIAEEKAAVKGEGDAKKKGKGGGWLGKILGSVGTLGKFIVGGFGKILLKAIPVLVKMTGRVTGAILGKVAPRLAGMIAKGSGSLLGGAAKMAGRGAMMLGRAAIPALLGATKVVGGAVVGAVGTTGLVIAGAVAAAGLLIYGGYKLYKYLHRNDVAGDIFGQLTRLRLLMYGFNDAKKESYYRLLELEMMMQDYVQFKDNKVTFVKLDADFKEKIRKLFEVKPDEKEKFAILNTWFVKRFMPSFKAFLDAFMPLGPNLYLDKLDKLSKDQVFKLASTLTIPTDIYDVTQVPTFDNPVTSVSTQEVTDMLTAIRNKAKADSKALEGQGTKKVSDQNTKQAAATPPAVPATPPPVVTPPATTSGPTIDDVKKAAGAKATNASTSQGPESMSQAAAKGDTPQQEGEAPVKDTPGKPVNPGPSTVPPEATKLNIAPGNLQPGDKTLQGITVGAKGNKDRLSQLNPKVFSLFTGMTKEFNTLTGKNVTVNESFRSYDDQAALRKQFPNKAAKPGSSIHEFGMALDVNTPEANLLDDMGLLRKYGFTRPVGGETWHLEPAGVAVNPQAAKSDPQLREQALDSSPGRGGGGYGASKSSPLGKRNQPLQEKLFNEGSASTVDLAALTKKDESVQQFKGPAPATPETTTAQKTDKGPSVTPKAVVASTPTPSAPSVASASTQDSLTRSGATTLPTASLEANPKTSNANLDPGAIGTKNLNPADAIRKASNVVGMNPESMVTFAKLESSLDPKAGATTSSAKGLFQITKPTWNGLLSSQGSKYNVPKDADIFDPYYNSLMGISYAKENAASVIPIGKQAGLPDEASLYLAHHFGPSGSKKVLDSYVKNPSMPTQEAVSSATYSANQSALAGKTVGEYIKSLSSKMSTAAGTPESSYKGMKGAGSSDSTPVGTNRVIGASNVVTESNLSATTPTSYKASSSPSSSPPPPPASRMERPEMPSSSGVTSTPIPQSNIVATPLPPQPSQTQNLNPSNEILTNQLNVLIDIKKILEGIGGLAQRPGGGSNNQPPAAAPMLVKAPSPTSTPSASPPPIVAPVNRAPSSTSVSMSRRVLT